MSFLSIEDLEEMRDFSLVDIFYKIDEIMTQAEPRCEKAMVGKVQATRDLRKHLADIKLVCDIIRAKVQTDKGKSRKRDILEMAIQKRKEDLEKAGQNYETKLRNMEVARQALNETKENG